VFADRPIVELHAASPVETMRALETHPDVEKTSIFGTAVHAVLRGRDVTIEDVRAWLAEKGLAIESADVVEPSLEDVFLDVVEKESARHA
jgi:hypothetical protein